MNRILLLLALAALTASGCAYGQQEKNYPPKHVRIDTLDFADFASDTLFVGHDSSYLALFFEKLDQLIQTKQGNINILHLGASHVQAGTMSHAIRKDILNAYPDLIASRGLIFPYSAAAKCNNPGDYKVSKNVTFSLIRNVYQTIEKPLGASGIAVYTNAPNAEITIKRADKSLKFNTSRITLLGYPDSDSTEVLPTIVVNNQEFSPVEYSSVRRRYVYEVPTVADSFRIKLNCVDSSTFVITGILLENDHPGITFHSIGVNGAQAGSYLKCVDFEEDMELVKPDLVIFGIGINDAMATNFDTTAFVNNYLKLVEQIRHVNPDCAFVFITNNDSYRKISKKYVVNSNGLLARRAFYRLAELTGGAVWDQFAIMGGLESMDKWYTAGYAQKDHVHFTNSGYNLLGHLFFNAFSNCWGRFEAKRRP